MNLIVVLTRLSVAVLGLCVYALCHAQATAAERAADDVKLAVLSPVEWQFNGELLLGARGPVLFLWNIRNGDLFNRRDTVTPNYVMESITKLTFGPGEGNYSFGARGWDGQGQLNDHWILMHDLSTDQLSGHRSRDSQRVRSIDAVGDHVLLSTGDASGYRLSTNYPSFGYASLRGASFIFKGDEVMFSPSGQVILDVADWRVLLWDAEDVRQLYLHEVGEGEAGIVTARICPLDDRLLILTDDGRLSVRSIADDAEVAAVEPGGSEVAGGSTAGAGSGAAAGTGRQAGGTGVGRDFAGAEDAAEIQRIEFCRGGEEFLVVRSGGSLTLYDTATCEMSYEFKFGGHIQKVTVSADGNFACISMSEVQDGEVSEYILLDLQKRELISTLPGRMVNSAGQDALRQLVGFSPHGDSILFVDSEGRTAELWDPASGYEIATVPLSYVMAN